MTSGRSIDERKLRELIWSLRQSCSPPLSFGEIGRRVAAQLDLKKPLHKNTVAYKYHAHCKWLLKHLEGQTALAKARAIEDGALVDLSLHVPSAKVENDFYLFNLKKDFNAAGEMGDLPARAAIASVAIRHLRFKGEGEMGGQLLSLNELIAAIHDTLLEEPDFVRKRILGRLYDRFGEAVARFWDVSPPGSG